MTKLENTPKPPAKDQISKPTKTTKAERPRIVSPVKSAPKKEPVAPALKDATTPDTTLPSQSEKETITKPEHKTPTHSIHSPGDFDWDVFDKKGFGEGYSETDREHMKNLYSGTVASINEGEVVEGTVITVNDRDVVFDIGFKSDGMVLRTEFKDLPDIKSGDKIDLFVEMREDPMGQLVLSRKKAKLVKSWNKIQAALDEDTVLESFVKRRTKGGLIVDLYGIEAFLPGSQIDVKPIRDFNIYVDKTIEVKVVKINHVNNNIVVSHKVLIEKDIEDQKTAIINNLEKGQILEGIVKNMTNFGVFVDLGGVVGLLHITDISWGRMSHPNELLQLDQTLKVVVLDLDESKNRISLGMKQLIPHPWDSLLEDIDVNSRVKGKITNVVDYGAFLEIQPGVEGLIHISEMSWSQHLTNPHDFVKVGDELEAVILTISREEKKMSLGIKQLTEDPWTRADLPNKYAVNTKHTGIVRNLTNFGLFIELEEGIDGLVHVSDLSWLKNVKHPSEFIKVGDSLEVMVLELETSLRRLSLSHKHIEDNPWETFKTVFVPGSIHKCTVLSKSDKGSVLELPYGVEVFCPASNLIKEDDKRPEIGEVLNCKVMDFSISDRKVLMSHKEVWKSKNEGSVAKNKPQQSTKKTTLKPKSRNTQASEADESESTLGKLKKKMMASDTKSSKSKEKKK